MSDDESVRHVLSLPADSPHAFCKHSAPDLTPVLSALHISPSVCRMLAHLGYLTVDLQILPDVDAQTIENMRRVIKRSVSTCSNCAIVYHDLCREIAGTPDLSDDARSRFRESTLTDDAHRLKIALDDEDPVNHQRAVFELHLEPLLMINIAAQQPIVSELLECDLKFSPVAPCAYWLTMHAGARVRAHALSAVRSYFARGLTPNMLDFAVDDIVNLICFDFAIDQESLMHSLMSAKLMTPDPSVAWAALAVLLASSPAAYFAEKFVAFLSIPGLSLFLSDSRRKSLCHPSSTQSWRK